MNTGTVPVEFNTRKHVKAFLLNNFGKRPFFDATHIFHNFLMLCLTHQLTYRIDSVPDAPEKMNLYITKNDYLRFGCYMNPRQQQLFTVHVDFYMKTIMHIYFDSYIEHAPQPKLTNGVYHVLSKMKLDESEWAIDTIVRNYHRYRKAQGLPLLYDKPSKNMNILSDLNTPSKPSYEVRSLFS